MTQNQTFDSILEKAAISRDVYMNALKVSHCGCSVILKRDPCDVNINGCNHEILCLWGANIDFQFVLDEYSTVMYICSYMMKSEKAMGEVLKSVARECHSDPIDQQLKKIGKAFVGHRVVSAPEAAMWILSMWLMKKSRKVIFVDSNVHDDRISLPKNNKTLGDMDEDEENVYMTSIHDRYASRPDFLNDMCLVKFAVNYEPVFKNPNTLHTDDYNDIHNHSDEEDDESQNRATCNVIHLKNNLGVMHKQKSESILCVKSYKMNIEPDKYYHARLLLYLPWHTEDELLGEYVTYRHHYVECNDVIEHNAHAFHLHSNEMDAAIENITENGPPEIAWDYIAPTIEENNIQMVNEDRVIVRHVDSDEDEEEVNDIDVPIGGNDTHDPNSRRNKLSSLFE